MNGEDFKRLEQVIVDFKEDVKAEFRHQIGIQSEHFQHKLDIVAEGHDNLRKEIRDTREELCEKIKWVDFKLETMNKTLKEQINGVAANVEVLNGRVGTIETKLDAVAADLKAHRTDTEVHKKVYKVKED